MTVITNAIYKNGVFKPAKPMYFSEREKVWLVAMSQKEWKKQFTKLLKSIHQRSKKFSSSEIEKDITLAFQETQKK